MHYEVFNAAFIEKNFETLRRSVQSALEAGKQELFVHPLGFYYTRLAERDKSSVRLHYWRAHDQGSGTAVTPYHDHVWKLKSCVLFGELENELFQIEEDTEGNFTVSEITQIHGVDVVKPGNKPVSICTQSRSRYSRGDFYEIEPRAFHRTVVSPDTPTVTVVCADVVIAGGPRTLMPLGSNAHSPARVPLSEPSQVLSEIHDLLSAQR